ncbi:MAG: N-acetyltransferase, partial [Neisseriales bacterium]
MEIQIEQAKDYSAVESLVQNAFVDVEFSDHQEHLLVKRLRKSAAFIPELALVAKIEDEIVGYILYSKIKIINDNQEYKVLAVAPLAVLPKKQKQGIGSA